MSEDNNKAEGGAQNVINTVKANPKVLYGLGGALVLGVLAMMMGGGDDVKVRSQAAVATGQSIALENPNGGSSHLTTVPGLQSASDAEEDKDLSVCVVSAGTRATVEEEQMVGQLPYVKVKITDGDCQGKSGWTSKVNVKG